MPGSSKWSNSLRSNLISLSHCLASTQASVRFRGLCVWFVICCNFLRWRVVSTSPNPQAGEPPLVGCSRLLIQHIRSYPPYLEAVPPSATWGRAMPWWQGPTYHCDRDPLITVTGTHLSPWQGPTYHYDRDPPITVTGTHLSPWQGPTYHCDRDPLITVTGTHLSLWQGPTYHRDRDPLITMTETHLSPWQVPTHHETRIWHVDYFDVHMASGGFRFIQNIYCLLSQPAASPTLRQLPPRITITKQLANRQADRFPWFRNSPVTVGRCEQITTAAGTQSTKKTAV
jgi:hypothetical protein